jgi:hypothetical protein
MGYFALKDNFLVCRRNGTMMQLMRLKLPIAFWATGLTAVVLLVFAVALAADEGTDATTNPRLQAAERLVIRYSASGFELVSRTPLLKILPPSVALPVAKGAVSGSWFEVQSDGGDPVYRRRIVSPRIIYTEVPTDDAPDRLTRDEIAVDENVFSVLVPAGKDAKSLVFYDSNLDVQKRTEAATEIGRIGLR